MLPITNPARPTIATTPTERTPTTTVSAALARPTLRPTLVRCHSTFPVATRHGAVDPVPIARSTRKAIGTATLSKNGRPTATSRPVNASTSSGYIVPNKTVKPNSVIRRLFARMKPSRETKESRRGDEATTSDRMAKSAKDPIKMTPKNPSKRGPTLERAKA